MDAPRVWLDDSSDEEYNDEMEEAALVAATLTIAGVQQARTCRAEARLVNQRYLCHHNLLPNPRANTPWQILYSSQDDRAFITTMGIDCATFNYILEHGFAARWNNVTYNRPCCGSEVSGAPATAGRRASLGALAAAILVAVTLSW